MTTFHAWCTLFSVEKVYKSIRKFPLTITTDFGIEISWNYLMKSPTNAKYLQNWKFFRLWCTLYSVYCWKNLLSKKISPDHNNMGFLGLLSLKPVHSGLDGMILSKKSPLCQNGLQLNRNCLQFIVRYSPSPFLSAF